MLKTSDAIDHRRWIRIVIKDEAANLWFTLVGRAVRCENALEAFSENDVTLYRYGIEFTFPGPMSVHDFKLIETLASKSFTLRPGRDAPQIPSFRPGFLA